MGEIAELNEPLLQRMADAFSKLPQKVIWKMKLEGMFINTTRNILIQARKSNYNEQRTVTSLVTDLPLSLYREKISGQD